jgi:hypothetical protein
MNLLPLLISQVPTDTWWSMKVWWWIPLTCVIIGWALKFFEDAVRLWWQGPKLVLQYEQIETGTNVPGIRQFYANIRVGNSKSRTAIGCRGYLKRIEEMQGDKVVKNVFETTLNCIWEFDGDRDTFDIPQGGRPAFNVVSYTDGQNGFSPCLRLSNGQPLNSLTYQHVFGQNGKFRFTGIVTCPGS